MKHTHKSKVSIPALLIAGITCVTTQPKVANASLTEPTVQEAETQEHDRIYQLAETIKTNPSEHYIGKAGGMHIRRVSFNGNHVLLRYHDRYNDGPSPKDSLFITIRDSTGKVLETFFDRNLDGFHQFKEAEKAYVRQHSLDLEKDASKEHRDLAQRTYQNRVSTLLKRLTQ
jgi:hypothetical protein